MDEEWDDEQPLDGVEWAIGLGLEEEDGGDDVRDECAEGGGEENEEVEVILRTDTIVHPWTV